MPLASSREAARKRAEASAANRKKAKRMSLPSTIKSATHVDEEKVRRRQSLSRQHHSNSLQSKENNGPGPTPYYQVAETRGNMSPRETRSAKKSKLPPMIQKGGGFQLNFSPPDQEANHRRELEAENERRSRIEKKRAAGQLLEFNMNNMGQDYTFPDTPAKEDPPSNNTKATSKFSAESSVSTDTSSSGVHTKAIGTEITTTLNSLKEWMQQNKLTHSGEDNTQIQMLMETFEQHKKKLEDTNQKLEAKNDTLQHELRQTNEKWHEDKNSHLVVTTRLETELKEYERHAKAQVEDLKQIQQQLEAQLAQVRNEKAEQLERCHHVEQQLVALKIELETSKSNFESLRAQNDSEKENIDSKYKEMEDNRAVLMNDIGALEKANNELNQKVHDYQQVIANLQNTVIPQLQSSLDHTVQELKQKDTAFVECEGQLAKLNQDANDLRQMISEQTATIKALEQDNAASSTTWNGAIAEKDSKISKLLTELSGAKRSIQEKQEECALTTKKLNDIEAAMTKQLEERDIALGFAKRQLEECETAKQALTDQVEQLEQLVSDERQHRQTVEQELERAKAQVESESNHVQGLTEREQQFQARLRDMEQKLQASQKELKTTEMERDDARSNMAGFSDRENELYRKLREGDAIRRNLHARVMQLAGNIRVFVRVRPPLPHELVEANVPAADDEGGKRKRTAEQVEDTLFRFPGVYDRCEKSPKASTASSDDLTKNLIVVTEPYKDRGGLKERRKQWKFGFDNVFSPEHGQDDVWEATEPLIQSAVDGFNVTLFAYGQTGSGKTYTMLGEDGYDGLIGRSVVKLFHSKHEIEELSRGAASVELSVELLEVYNEKVFDLLAPQGGDKGRELSLKVTSKEVVGNVLVPTASKEDVMKVLALAQSRRCVKATASNKESSRSHMIFTIHFQTTLGDGTKRNGKLNVCDLAGSERLKKSGAHQVGGALLEETKNINKSLSALSNVIERLQAGDKNIPFRDSKLTFLLQDSLGGNSKTLAIVCCNPLTDHFSESLCSLKFAEKVNKVDLKAVANFSA